MILQEKVWLMFFLKEKYEAFKKFKEFKFFVEKQCDYNIKILISNRRWDFTSNEFYKLL